MSFDSIFSITGISASGLSAERLRMETIANNIANANSTRDVDGQPFRRREVSFESSYAEASQGLGGRNGTGDSMSGVRVVGVFEDASPFPLVYRPGHPDANADGFVKMPNVKVSNEMVDLITASRGYEANLKVLKAFREMANQALDILRRS